MVKQSKHIITADLSIIPMGVGTSVGEYIAKAYEAMNEVKSVNVYPTGTCTTIEAEDLQIIWQVVEVARQSLLNSGVKRMYIILKIDDRHDKSHSTKYKLERMVGKE